MGEIKSTLDLVMEKTKHLSLSDEEKQNQKKAELEKRVNGLLQKYQDQVLSMDQLHGEYARLKQELSLPDDSFLVNQALTKIDLTGDNRHLLELLKQFCGSGTGRIETILNEFQDEFNSAASYRLVELREDLARQHAISGSAVVPNLQADDAWRAEAGEIRSRFEKTLEAEKDQLG
ncbi:MAG: hypothetical protein JRF72_04565 [Deltaproteobacteria bacterium]|jgi:predicted DsbA family dithiol-disulfide isomerase|nr:hypothetical protein [Deltaproteobacteria bacterium]